MYPPILILAVSYHAQTKRTPARLKAAVPKPCTFSIADKTTFRGFYLGQDKSELTDIPNFDSEYDKARSNGVDSRAKFGFVLLSNVDLAYQTPGIATPLGKGLDEIGFYLHFLDGKLMFVSVEYQEYEPDNLLMFIKQVSATTKFPIESWQVKDKSHAVMKCADFDVDVWTGKYEFRPAYSGYPSLMLTDRRAAAELDRRQKEYKQRLLDAEIERKRIEREKKKTFKP